MKKPPLAKSKLQTSRFNKQSTGLKKSSSRLSVKGAAARESDEESVVSSRLSVSQQQQEQEKEEQSKLEEELEPTATLSGQRFEELMALEAEKKKLDERNTELEAQVKTLKEERVREVAKLKTEAQAREKALDQAKEEHRKELAAVRADLGAQLEEAQNTSQADVLAGKDRRIESLEGSVSLLEEDKEGLAKELKASRDEAEELKVQVEIEREEKELLKLQAEQAQQQALAEDAGPLSEKQLQAENEKLKIALRQVSGQLEMDKATRAQELVELRAELERAKPLRAQLMEKEQDVTILLEELEEKETQFAEKEAELGALQERLDGQGDLDLMVEELTTTVLEREDEIERLQGELATAKEELEIEEEATNEAEKLAEILQGEVDAKLLDLERARRETKGSQQRVSELEQLVGRFREKVGDLSEEKRVLADQLVGSGAEEKERGSRIDQLVESQTSMAQKLREAYRKELALRQAQIEQNQKRAKTDWLLALLPGKLLEQARVDSFEKVQLLETLKAKTYLLLREIGESSFLRARPGDAEAALVEEVDIHHVFRWVCELYYNVAGLLDVLLRMGHVLLRLEVPAYHEVCALDAWGDLLAASYFVDTLLHRTKEETLSPEAA